MFKKRGKVGQPVKNGTRYKKCTLRGLKISFADQIACLIVRNNQKKKIPSILVTF